MCSRRRAGDGNGTALREGTFEDPEGHSKHRRALVDRCHWTERAGHTQFKSKEATFARPPGSPRPRGVREGRGTPRGPLLTCWLVCLTPQRFIHASNTDATRLPHAPRSKGNILTKQQLRAVKTATCPRKGSAMRRGDGPRETAMSISPATPIHGPCHGRRCR